MAETVRAALRRSSNALASEQAARRLLADCLEQSWGWVSLHYDAALSDEQQARLDHGLDRAQTGEPLAYITGRVGFWTRELGVSPDVLIPRPATETLVECALQLGDGKEHSVLDLGTGSGAIALALAVERPTWAVTATDRNGAALAVAQANADACQVNTVRFLAGDWFGAVPGERFDGIVCNPPYIALDDSAVEDSVRKFEPGSALFSTHNGLDDLATIIGRASSHLRARGWLAVEHGFQQADAVRGLFEAAGFAQVTQTDDLEGHPRVTTGRLPEAP